MKTKSNIKKIALYSALIIMLFLVVMRLMNNKETVQNRIYTYDKEQPIKVESQVLKLVKIDNDFQYSGTFEPNRESKISSEVQGKINSVLVDAGSLVQKGQTLVVLDNSLLKLQLQSIDVQLEGLEADVKRYTVLAKEDAVQGIQLEKAQLGLNSARVQRLTVLEQINKTLIKAPFDGVVTAKLTEIGSFAAPGIPLIQLSEMSNLRFTINVSEKDLPQFKQNQKNIILVDAFPGKTLKGTTIMIGNKSNLGNSFPVQIAVQNLKDNAIKAGMFGQVRLQSQSDEKGIVIPASVITGTPDKPKVYVIKNGKARLVEITLLKRTKDKAVVSHGLKVGDVLIIKGFINLFEGANVIIL